MHYRHAGCSLAALILLTLNGCSEPESADGTRPDLPTQIDALLEQTVANNAAVRSAFVGVSSADPSVEYHAATGILRDGSDQAVTVDDQFMIASISKTIVATRVLQLSEQGVFNLDDTLASIGVFSDQVIDALHQIDGTSYGSQITIRQLLNHTTGLKDYLLDDRQQISRNSESGVAPGSLAGIWMTHLESFLTGYPHPECESEAECEHVLYPARQWAHWDADAYKQDPADRDAGLLNFYLAEMADSALFPPGEDAHYSDTNYLLLGLVIEAVSGESLDAQLRANLFEPLGMSATYVSYTPGQEHPTPRVSDWYALNVPMVSSGADVSWDWAGGGVVTSSKDLLTFITALMNGHLYENPATLEAMLDPISLREEDGRITRGYGLGISYRHTDLGPRWGHGGAWGANMVYFTDHDIAVVGTVNDYGSGPVVQQLTDEIAALMVSR